MSIFNPYDHPKRALALKLVVLARQLRQSFDERVESAGITSAKWTLIAAVAHNPGATQRAIAELLNVAEVTAGRMIDRLCADGYLRRRPHPQDRRAYCVDLTKAASPLLEQLSEVAALSENEAFAGLSDADLAQLEAFLDAISANISSAKSKSGSAPEEQSSREASK